MTPFQPVDTPKSFTTRLLSEIARGAPEKYTDNLGQCHDVAFGKPSTRGQTSFGRQYNTVIPKEADIYVPLFPQYERLSDRLDDEASRDLLARIVAYRLMGRRAVRLPLNNPDFLERERQIAGIATPSDLTSKLRMGAAVLDSFALDRIDMRPLGFDLTLLSQPALAAVECVIGRYRCPGIGASVDPGDVVIDCGACWGDSALHAALDAGPEGRVFAFEFEPDNLIVLKRALEINPHLNDRVEVVETPVWDVSDRAVHYVSNGPGSRLTPEKEDNTILPVETLTIDDFVDEAGLDRVDFIKMNLEGAEPRALRGARRTIERFRPKLAICLDSQPHHYVELPRLLDEWVPEYRFRLGHYAMTQWETVLHAAVTTV